MNTKQYGLLLLLTFVLAVSGVVTLLRASGASYPSVLGYKSLCTFAPAGSLFCFLAAGITCVLRASLVKRPSFSGGKPVFKVVPIVVLVVVLGLAIGSTVWFLDAKSSYTDGGTAATAS